MVYLSIQAQKFFCMVQKEFGAPGFGKMLITASNDLNMETTNLEQAGTFFHVFEIFGV